MASLKNAAYQLIKDRILDGTYPANDIIDEKLIAAELHSSRTPIREAMIALDQEGYLQIIPKRGIFVAPFTYQDALAIFQVRELIEPWLIRTYGPILTREELQQEREAVISEVLYNREHSISDPGISINHHPHSLLISKCDNKNILFMLHHVEEQSRRNPSNRPRKMQHRTSEFYDAVMHTHLELVDAMLEGDFARAEAEMVEHLRIGKTEYMQFWFG